MAIIIKSYLYNQLPHTIFLFRGLSYVHHTRKRGSDLILFYLQSPPPLPYRYLDPLLQSHADTHSSFLLARFSASAIAAASVRGPVGAGVGEGGLVIVKRGIRGRAESVEKSIDPQVRGRDGPRGERYGEGRAPP